MIDLRSDTITQPTAAMRQAIAEARVGDDVFGDDPTVKELERRTAELLGKPAALFMPSGTMSNQVAVRSHTEPGDEILIEGESHIYYYEAGAPAALSGVSCRLLPGVRGIFSADDVRAQLRPRDQHYPVTRLLCIENTHNRGGGAIWPIDRLAQVAAVAKDAGLKLHLDGARLWNAAAATGISERQFAQVFDTISVCFSKGLGAPVGSCLVGDEPFIQRARRFRKQFGGGMRQAGLLAAAALYALDHHRARLVDDHANAKLLAEGLARIPGIECDPANAETNIVIFRITTMPAADFCQRLHDAGVWLLPRTADTARAVTHLHINRQQILDAIEIVRSRLSR